MLGALGEWFERLEDGRRRQVLLLLSKRPMSEAELAGHFGLTLTLGWHLRELHALGLIAYSRRADRYHLVWPAVEKLAAFCDELDVLPAEAARPAGDPAAAGTRRRPLAI